MPVNNSELLNVIQQVAEDANITVTVQQSGMGALMVGVCAFTGGLIGGPRGLAIGGAIGAAVAAAQGAGAYKSVPYIIMYEMTAEQRNLLATSMRRVLGDLRAGDSVTLLTIIRASSSLKSLVVRELGQFLTNEMGLTLNM